MAMVETEYLRQWIGKVECNSDCVTAVPVMALKATLDQSDITVQTGDLLPPMWHILYFLPICRQSELSQNGHPKTGGFIPPIPLPLRMYAGGRIWFHQPLRVSEQITRKSTIADVSFRQGRTGPLVFVKINHEICNARGLAVSEDQDIVYRQKSTVDYPVPEYQQAPESEAWSREVSADAVTLFRFSALTFNSHRIHYDHPYTTGDEGYPGLIVHGPLLVILLLDLLHQHVPDAQLREFRFKAVKPIFASNPFVLCGSNEGGDRVVHLWVRDSKGHLCLDASAMLA